MSATRRSRLTAGVAIGVVFAVVSALTGCGVPLDADDRPISRGNIPIDLQRGLTTTTTTTTTSTTSPPVSTIEVRTPEYRVNLYFLDQFRLVPIVRPLPEEPTPEILLAYLSLGPRDTDGVGLTTALTSTGLVRSTRVSKGQIEVELGSDFDLLGGVQQAQLFMQLTATLTELGGVGAVSYSRDGEPISVLRPDFELAEGPQTKDDVSAYVIKPGEIPPLDPPSTSTSSTTTTVPASSAAVGSAVSGAIPRQT
jgi:Sporulation and spore germination